MLEKAIKIREQTKRAFFWTYIVNTPFWAILTMMPFIMYQDLKASAWQITFIVALKPAVALFSLYWSAHVSDRPDRLKPNIMWGTVIGHLPFFLFPWISSPWYFIFSFAICMLLARGVVPAWMEVLRLNLPGESRRKHFASVSSICYIGNALFPLAFGWFLDGYFESWRWIFPITALISCSAVFFQWMMPVTHDAEKVTESEWQPLHHHATIPWKKVWVLLKSRPDFVQYQWGFMLGAFGLIVIQPALPHFFMGDLKLSYTEIGAALTVCKGVGFASTSQIWAKWMSKVNIFRFNSLVTLFAALFPLGLMAAKESVIWLYVAYLGYGVMQAGSELSWKLSGPIFSKDADSSLFSSVNVLTVGLRGLFIPFLGSLILLYFGVIPVLWVCFSSCLLATLYMFRCGGECFHEVVSDQ